MSLVCNGERVVGNGSPLISRVFVGSPSASFNSHENDVVCSIHRISVYAINYHSVSVCCTDLF